MRFRMGEPDEPVLLREHPAGIESPELSPDGQWLAYITWESGEVALEVADYPAMRSRHQVVQSETDAHWSGDGRYLFFASRELQAMMMAELEPGPGFVVRAVTPLFDLEPLGVKHFSEFDVSSDGQEFILRRNPLGIKGKKTFTVVENWFEEFRE